MHEMGKCPLLCTCDRLDPSERSMGKLCGWHGGGRIRPPSPTMSAADAGSLEEIDALIEEITKGI